MGFCCLSLLYYPDSISLSEQQSIHYRKIPRCLSTTTDTTFWTSRKLTHILFLPSDLSTLFYCNAVILSQYLKLHVFTYFLLTLNLFYKITLLFLFFKLFTILLNIISYLKHVLPLTYKTTSYLPFTNCLYILHQSKLHPRPPVKSTRFCGGFYSLISYSLPSIQPPFFLAVHERSQTHLDL